MPPDDSARSTPPFLSGPLPADEIERLLRIVDERVRLRGEVEPMAEPPPDAAAPLDPVTTFEGESLRDCAAPLFHTGRGSPLLRAAKTLANFPLGLLGRPQAYFNEALRRVIASWAAVLGATLDNLAALQREVAAQRARLAELESRLARLERGEEDRPPS